MSIGGITFAISSVALLYDIVLSVFRYSTFEIENKNETATEFTVFAMIFSVSGYLYKYADFDVSHIIQILLAIADVLLVRRVYLKHVVGVAFKKLDLEGKVFIITGCNAGIGSDSAG